MNDIHSPLSTPVPPVIQGRARLGHVHLNVSDLPRAESFYRELTGLSVTERLDGHFAFMSWGTAHHDLALRCVPAAPADRTSGMAGRHPHDSIGLYHVAFEVAGAAQLLTALETVRSLKIPYSLVDHGISWALYTQDPDGNGVEIYFDRRNTARGRQDWHGRSFALSEDRIHQEALHQETGSPSTGHP